jgi:hypothetical protein
MANMKLSIVSLFENKGNVYKLILMSFSYRKIQKFV